jgi:hypothetical protein
MPAEGIPQCGTHAGVSSLEPTRDEADPARSREGGRPGLEGSKLALLTLACWLIHASVHWRRGSAPDLVWGCNLGALFIAIGLFFVEPSLVAVGTFWLAAGTPLWIMDLLFGGEWLYSSLLTHGVVFSLAIRHVVRGGLVEGAWWRALLGGALLQQCSRWLTHWSLNVNVAWGIYPPMRRYFSDFSRYWLATFVYLALLYFALDRALRWLHRRRSALVRSESP